MNPKQVANTVIVATMIEVMTSVIEADGGNDFAAPETSTVVQDAAAAINKELGGA
jgi:hypothetical protein